jgi:hypothetical protein
VLRGQRTIAAGGLGQKGLIGEVISLLMKPS